MRSDDWVILFWDKGWVYGEALHLGIKALRFSSSLKWLIFETVREGWFDGQSHFHFRVG